MTESDVRFRELAGALADLSFTTGLTESQLRAVKILEDRGKGIRIYRFKGNRYMVSYYSAGACRTWCRTSDAAFACRISDMITVRNAAQRVRMPKPLTPDDFNISEQQARADLANEADIVSMLIHMELTLPDITREPGRPKGRKNKTLRAEVMSLFDKINFRLDDAAGPRGHEGVLAILRSIEHRLSVIERASTLVVYPQAPPLLVPCDRTTPQLPYEVTCGTAAPMPPPPSSVCVNAESPTPFSPPS